MFIFLFCKLKLPKFQQTNRSETFIHHQKMKYIAVLQGKKEIELCDQLISNNSLLVLAAVGSLYQKMGVSRRFDIPERPPDRPFPAIHA